MVAQDKGDYVHTISLGSGTPHVYATGAPHMDHRYLRPWLDPLGDVATLVLMDLAGTGRSSFPETADELDHDRWLGDIEQTRARLSPNDSVVLFGHSYGGFLAQEYALRFPGRLAGVILCATAPAIDYPEVILANAEAYGDDRVFAAAQRALTEPMESDRDLEETWKTILPLYFHRLDRELAEDAFAQCSFTSQPWNRAVTSCLPAFNVTAELHALNVPVLALNGRHDWLTPLEHGVGRIASLVPEAEVVVFEESGHFPFIEENERFVRVVSDWLGRLTRG